MLIDLAEKPVPPTEMVRRLKQIDPRLGLTFSSTVDPATDRLRPTWALTMEWLPDDPRRVMIQDGTIPLSYNFDILCWLPFDCSPDEAYGYVVQKFTLMQDKPDVKRMLERVHTYNQAARTEALRPTMELAEELFETNKHRIRSDAVRKHRVETQASKDKKFREYVDQ